MSDSIADRVRQRLEELGLTPYAASMKASGGRSKDLVGNILNNRSHSPRGDTLTRVANALETSVEWLLHGDASPVTPQLKEQPTSNVRVSDVRIPPRSQLGSRDLPVMGTASGSLGKGSFVIEDRAIDYVIRPNVLLSVQDAYGIYVQGDSMDPAHPHGELRIVHPHRPCQIGDSVIIIAHWSEHQPLEAWIKRLVKRTSEKLIVEQFNPKATIEFERRYVQAMHKVLTMNDLMGI